MKQRLIAIIVTILALVLFATSVFFTATKTGREIVNNWKYGLQKVDDRTKYETIKKVEDTCRAMIASYEADKLTYEQYKDSDNPEKQGWAEQAKMRANKTASTYNNYILQNSFVWEDNIPTDIYLNLEIVN